MAQCGTYLSDVTKILKRHWPDNRTVNIAFHGHSVPAGYFATPLVNTFDAYPHLLHVGLKHRFPFAVVNVIVTAIGGEDSESGANRFVSDVLRHRPDVIFIDYGLNDRGIGLSRAQNAWRDMIEHARGSKIPVILLTPTMAVQNSTGKPPNRDDQLVQHAMQIRALADEYDVGLVDSFSAFENYLEVGTISDLLSWENHPNRRGHELVARELLRWFPIA